MTALQPRTPLRVPASSSIDVDDCPRVLVVVAPSLGGSTGTGITFGSLFRGWPLDRIAQVYCDAREPDPAVCARHWMVSPADVPLDRWAKRLAGKNSVDAMRNTLVGMPPGGSPEQNKRGGFRRKLIDSARAWSDTLRYQPPAGFWTWVDEFKPEVIFSNLGSIRTMDLIDRLLRRTAAPLVPFFNDDWPRTHFAGNALSAIPRRILLQCLRSNLTDAPVGMAGSFAMAREYRDRYAMPFEPFMVCVPVPDERPTPPEGEIDRPMRLMYVGGLHLDRWRAIQEVGLALRRLNQRGVRVEAVVHAPDADCDRYARELTIPPVMKLGGSIPPERMAATLAQADVLLHVESFDPVLRKYTRLSLSTKIPQYMAAGRPILAYGPAEVSSCQYIAESGCGRVVGEPISDTLEAALEELAASPQLRTKLGTSAWETARLNHEIVAVRDRFKAVLSGAARTAKRI